MKGIRPHGNQEFDVRRIFLKEDAERIKELQAHASEFEQHYPQHMKWLEMALGEVVTGKRLAFGIFSLAFNTQRQPVVELVGCTILKPRRYSNVIEMKNYFIRKSSRGRGYGKALYKAVEEHCARVGYDQIESEVPCSEISTIGFFHRMGFHITEMQRSPYKPSDYHYRIEKLLVPRYHGDSYDLYELSLWLVGYYYGFSNIKQVQLGKHFEFELRTSAFLSAKNGSGELTLTGNALVVESSDKDVSPWFSDMINSLQRSLLIIFTGSGFNPKGLELPRDVKVIEEQSIHRELGHLFSFGPPRFSREKIAGMVVPITPEYFSRIISSGKNVLSYFKTGPMGKYLRQGNRIMIFVEPTPDQPTGGVRAIATLQEVLNGAPEYIWQVFNERNPVLTHDEYLTFARNKHDVIGLYLTKFVQVETVDYSTLKKEVLYDEPDPLDIGHYYLSMEMVSRFLQRMRPLNHLAQQYEYDVVLSFAKEDRHYAEPLAALLIQNGVQVFYDKYEEANLWGKDLYQHLQSVYRDKARYCVIFISKYYAQRLWQHHELIQAQARAFRENREYILPVRIDNTEIPGINETIAYIDLNDIPIEKIAQILISKISTKS
ncbi:MAG: GNAT family N-acetyltransferase (plasmid) [Candidatus Methanoperedens sp.]|uniref:GNAT family N-acetyltransferase n=1 Tax=Candidatus Methanoperedens sp. BLZ2 TaxID=2035255 RepID=UPI000BE2ED52|nr:GNAT family N-acetyltransferase [Candidatus Methanoperedens sp. BLZ2]KAB2945272.1 MAG: GNAT family N-acetyltransferase [Candidatus Methanoperedens sp.]MBZ0175584.1 GNAT family N-acetyltransferase [Candidatus Methanoperedens nitroreducens]WAH95144.1 MAG: GNAT family N-acetyltransferase [Candidatus Methanoperedens sp.]WAM22296.1 MAG: GNAT family N-acetyltransferase [Candidatus Methanoperedens sp.]